MAAAGNEHEYSSTRNHIAFDLVGVQASITVS